MLPTKAEEADITGGDGTCCPRGDCRHGCSCNLPAGPFVQCGGPYQVIPLAEMSTAINNMYPPQRGRKKKVMAKISKSQFLLKLGSFPGGSMVKNLPDKQETWVRSLGWEDPLEEEMATHSSILAWEIPWKEEPGGLQSTGSQRVRHN